MKNCQKSRLFFDDLLDAKVREFYPRYAEAEGTRLGQFRHLHTNIYGNREFVEHLCNLGKFFNHEAMRGHDLILIDYEVPTNLASSGSSSIRRRRPGNGGLGHRSGQRALAPARGPHSGPYANLIGLAGCLVPTGSQRKQASTSSHVD